jgi:SAM-dependent methyltransferase
MGSRWSRSEVPRGADYDERFERLAAAGHDVHGEASLVAGYGPTSVLDAGCGTGRVAIELHRRGIHSVGVDLDRNMLERAAHKQPDIEWYHADLVGLDLRDGSGQRRRFHVVVAAGNVMIFLEPGTEVAAVASMAGHLTPGGLLIAGFQLLPGRYGVADHEAACAKAGLVPYERFSTWSRDPWQVGSGYVVDVHQLPSTPS